MQKNHIKIIKEKKQDENKLNIKCIIFNNI